MTLDHINLSVPDVAAASAFFTDFFGLRLREGHGRPGVLALLEDDRGFLLAISNLTKPADFIYPKDFHIGFSLGSTEQVDVLYKRLSAAGHTPGHAPRNLWGAYRFYVTAFETLIIEVSCHLEEGLASAPA